MSIRNERDRIAKSESPAGGGVHTELALQPADCQLLHAVRLQDGLWICVVERIRCLLSDVDVGWLNIESGGKVPAFRFVL